MRIVVVGIIVGGAIALAFLFLSSGGSDSKYRSQAESDRATAALAVAKCDSEMSTLDAEIESARRDPATAPQRTSKLIADRLSVCTKAQAAAQRARAVSKNDKHLEVAIERVARHLERIATTSPASIVAGSAAGSN
jgi:hypothetical protein